MLGSVAKWLRILGFDTLYNKSSSDELALELASAEGRVLLTKDEELWRTATKRGIKAVLVRGVSIEGMMVSVLQGYGSRVEVDPDKSRCAFCNARLVRVNRGSVKVSVPSSIYERHRLFWRCENCGRIYWAGTHVEEMRKTLARIRNELMS